MTRTLLLAAISGLHVGANATVLLAEPVDVSAAALKTLTPEGYKVEKTIACGMGPAGRHEVLIALSDIDEDRVKVRPVMLLLVALRNKMVVEDRVIPHSAVTGGFWDGPPNYFKEMTRENVGSSELALVRSVLSGGGSGSLHYFDFYRLGQNKLQLVKSFSHGRMEQTYFAVYKNAIYDAEKVCTRGEKHGQAYVYTCYLQLTKYLFDGRTIRAVGSERMREQRGNRYLQDKYWFISVLKALQKGEVFAQAP